MAGKQWVRAEALGVFEVRWARKEGEAAWWDSFGEESPVSADSFEGEVEGAVASAVMVKACGITPEMVVTPSGEEFGFGCEFLSFVGAAGVGGDAGEAAVARMASKQASTRVW
ncbi:MAG: hypothetical protein N2035_08905 [Chthoniobacterales bacterium]|nr:hypothetical protein [Chthoniobacterales bacterium]